MINYSCVLITEDGEEFEKLISAESKDELYSKVPESCFLIRSKRARSISGRKVKIAQVDLLSFTSQLSSLVSSGVNIDDALNSISKTTNPKIIKDLSRVSSQGVRDGNTLSSALDGSNFSIPGYYVSAISGGEKSNNLVASLDYLYKYISKSKDAKSKLRTALMYPTIVLMAAIAASSYLLAYVVPEMVKNYAAIGNELPEITKVIIGLSDFITSYGLYTFSVILFILFSSAILIKTSRVVRYYYYEFLSVLPVIGSFIKNTDKYNLLTTVGMLNSQGISLDIALGISKTGIAIPRMINSVDRAILDIRSGKKVSDSLLTNELLDESVAGIVRAGEDSNMISERLLDVSNILKERRDKVFETLTTIVGPISILMVGAIILTIALGMLMPMFNLNDINF